MLRKTKSNLLPSIFYLRLIILPILLQDWQCSEREELAKKERIRYRLYQYVRGYGVRKNTLGLPE